jgi:hypothetical protein
MIDMNKNVPFILLFIFISGFFITAINSAAASEIVEDSWNTKATMMHERRWFRVVTLDDKIYAIGGENSGINECYDPKTDRWTTLAPMPTPRSSFGVVAYQGKIYCIGGSVPYFGPVFVSQGIDVVEVYDPVTDTWSTKASLPIKTGVLSTCVVNDQIFVINYDSTMYMYNPSVDKWSSKTSIPVSTPNLTVRVINDQIFAICSSEAGWAMFMYEQTKNSWTKKADPYVLHGAFEVIVVDNKILMCDEPMHVDNLPLNFRIYDPETDKWNEGQTATKLAKGTSLFVGATYGVYAPKNGYVFGVEYSDIDTAQTLTWIYNPADDAWLTAKPMPIEKIHNGLNCVVVVDDILYIIGEYGTIDQYVPIGYRGTVYATPTPSNSGSSETSEPNHTLTYIVVAALSLTIGTVTVGLFLYFKKEGT